MSVTLMEIKDQCKALHKTIALVETNRDAILSFCKKPRAILFTGCGSSYSLSCSFRSMASMALDIPVYALAGGDLWLNAKRYETMLRDAVVISVSRSGKTTEIVNAFQAVAALNLGTRFLSIVCCDDTPMEHLSGLTLSLPWAFDSSVCQTRCVSNLYAAGMLTLATLAGKPQVFADFKAVAENGDAYLEKAEPLMKEMAKKPWTSAVVLADGASDGLSEEGALAFKEISQLQSNFYHILDVRHGPMVLIKERTVVLVSLKSPADAYELSLVKELVNRGATVICYSPMPVATPGAACSLSFGHNLGMEAAGMGLVMLCQLLSYYKSFEVGCDPDRPDGLDPWIQIS